MEKGGGFFVVFFLMTSIVMYWSRLKTEVKNSHVGIFKIKSNQQ